MTVENKPENPGARSDSDRMKDSDGAKEKTRAEVARLAGEARASAQSAAQDAAVAASEKANTAKNTAADELSDVASALRTAAGEMRSGSPQERTFGQIAESLADASDAMRNKDLGEMVQDVSAFARRNPMIFLAGAALVGFAATRFAKASGSDISEAGNTPGTGSALAQGAHEGPSGTSLDGELS